MVTTRGNFFVLTLHFTKLYNTIHKNQYKEKCRSPNGLQYINHPNNKTGNGNGKD